MKMLKQAKTIGIGLVVLGCAAFILNLWIKGEVGKEMGKVDAVTSPLSYGGQGGKMAGGMIGDMANSKAAGYLRQGQLLAMGGVALVLVGGYLIFFFKKKS